MFCLRVFVFSFKNKKDHSPAQKEATKQTTKDEQLFFHDIINHTHGLLLFLNQKEHSKNAVTTEEVQLIAKEIKTLQSLIKDQYHLGHKNLNNAYDWVSFDHAYKAFTNLIATYFPKQEAHIAISLQGEEGPSMGLIYYPSFYRMMNNLIKNMSEAHASKITFSFELKEEGLFIESTNDIKEQRDLPEYLSRTILNEDKSHEKGLGLESITHMATVAGGDFSFEIHNQVWLSRIFLPVKNNSSLEVSAPKKISA